MPIFSWSALGLGLHRLGNDRPGKHHAFQDDDVSGPKAVSLATSLIPTAAAISPAHTPVISAPLVGVHSQDVAQPFLLPLMGL